MKITSAANSNIALIKYWGKRDAVLNLPAVGSISLTLDGMVTETSVEFIRGLKSDELILNGVTASETETRRIAGFMNLVRDMARTGDYAQIISSNNFPTAAGLASSASAFAALALAATSAAGLKLPLTKLSELARRGSGSAARSVFGGFVEMHRGVDKDGSDAIAVQLADKSFWDIRVLIAVTSAKKKKIGSTDGMTLSRNTSPYYQPWIDSSENDLTEMRQAIHNKDFQKLGDLSEFSCLKMHALAIASNPGLLYWNGATLDGLHLIRELRQSGQAVYFTVDAGPQIKAICLPEAMDAVKSALGNLPGIARIIETRLGDGARIVGDNG